MAAALHASLFARRRWRNDFVIIITLVRAVGDAESVAETRYRRTVQRGIASMKIGPECFDQICPLLHRQRQFGVDARIDGRVRPRWAAALRDGAQDGGTQPRAKQLRG